MGEKVYYKRDKEDRWRGPARVIGTDGKTVIVKQGIDVREINRSHIIKVNKCGDYFGVKERDVQEEEEEDGLETGTGEEEEEEEGTWVAVREEERGDEDVSENGGGESSEGDDEEEEWSETKGEKQRLRMKEPRKLVKIGGTV